MMPSNNPTIPWHMFPARYGLTRQITKVATDTYVISGASRYMRYAEDMADFEGGPMLMVGDTNIFLTTGKPPFMDKREMISSVKGITHAEAKALDAYVSNDPKGYAFVKMQTTKRKV